jgi:hypothetical protein
MRTTTITRTIIGAGALSLLAAAPALAARPSAPSGSIDLMQPPLTALSTLGETPPPPLEVTYGEFADFDTRLEGKVSNKADAYVTVWCWQGGTGVYQQGDTGVYHASGERGVSFLMEDRGSQVLHWNGEKAYCEALLMYRVDKGKSSEITVLDSEFFTVVP